MTDLDLDALEATARAATPGPWVMWDDGDVGTAYPVTKKRIDRRTRLPHEDVVQSDHIANTYEEDGAFIAAANPQTVLALIAELRQERERADRVEWAAGMVGDVARESSGGWQDASAELHAVEARLREAEAVLAEIRANAAELLDADDDSYDGSLSAIWAVELIDAYETTKTENGSK